MKKYLIAEEAILKYIKDMALKPGDKLPTYREFADQLNASTYTIATAVDNLQNRGILIVRPQSGIFIAKHAWTSANPDEFAWEEYINSRKRLNKAEKGYMRTDPPFQLHNYSLSPEFNWYPLLVNSTSAAYKNLRDPGDLNDPMGAYGYGPLRAELANHVQHYGINISNNVLLPTGGTYAGLMILGTSFFSNRDICFVPSPSPFERLVAFRLTGIEPVPVPMDEEGLSVDYIAARINRNKKSYLIVSPAIQSMSGATMSMQRRRDIYHLCHVNGIPIIEIDEYRDFHPNPLPPMKAIDKHNIVIHVGTFAKVLSESINAGWIIVPNNISDEVIMTRLNHFDHFNMLAQMIVYQALCNGKFRKLTAEIRPMLQQRYQAYNAILQRHLGDIATWDRASNVFFWLKFADYIDVDKMAENVTDVTFLDYNFFTHAEKNSIMTSAIHHSLAELDTAVEKVAILARSCVR